MIRSENYRLQNTIVFLADVYLFCSTFHFFPIELFKLIDLSIFTHFSYLLPIRLTPIKLN